MAKREFLMLAHKYDPERSYVGGWYASEKLDGMRCFWDGGISRGIPKINIPWANNDKDSRYKEEQISTGLWTRYGNVIHAPSDWLDQLPMIPLDGELYIPEYRQELMKIVKQLIPGPGWSDVRLHVFDMPPLESVLDSGIIRNPNAKQFWTEHSIVSFLKGKQLEYQPNPKTPFMTRVKVMRKVLIGNIAIPHTQIELPSTNARAKAQIDQMLESVLETDGEGLILRAPMSLWKPERSKTLLKVKPFDDMEAKVIGYISGKGKHEGRIGSLMVESFRGYFSVGGLTDEERRFSSMEAAMHAAANPGTEMPEGFIATHFKKGDIVTVKYRGLSKDGIPQEARYFRKRNDEH